MKQLCRGMLTPLSNPTNRFGMTLLEIIFSIVILAAAMAVLSGLSRMGMQNAITAKDLTQAQLLCESILAELQIGALELESVYEEPVLDFPDTGASNPYDSNEVLWNYSVEISTIHDYGLLEVIVTVTKNEPSQSRPLSYRLVRWMIDQEVVAEVLSEREGSSSSVTTPTTTPQTTSTE